MMLLSVLCPMAPAHLVLWHAGSKQLDVQNTNEIKIVNTVRKCTINTA